MRLKQFIFALTAMLLSFASPSFAKVAKVGNTEYATLAEAVAAAQAGDEIVLLGDVAEDATLPASVKFNGNGKAVGNLTAGGEITFTGVTKATSFGVEYTNTTVNIVPGASLEITGTNRMAIGHGCTFNITGNITDAKTADKATLTPSLVMPGASFTGAGVTFNVNNAYIKATAYCSSKNNNASDTFDFNINNSIWEQTGVLAFYVPTSGMDPVVNFDLKNSVLTTTSHLVFSVTKGEIVFDNSNVNVGTSRQIENQSTMTIKNGSVVNGAVATSSNAKNPGTIIVENATYAVTGEFSGSDLGTGTIIVKEGATVSAGSITKANIQIDATGMAAGDEVNLTADLSKFAGTIEVVNNDNLDASIVDGKIVLAAKPVAKIGETKYATLAEAFKAATAGCTIDILADVTVDYEWDCRYTGSKFTVPVTINGNDHTLKFTNLVYDGGNHFAAFRFEADATVNNLTVDMTEAQSGFQGRFRAISSKANLTVNGCTFIGNGSANNTRAIIFGEGAGSKAANLAISVANSNFEGWRRGISDNENAQDVKSVTVTGNTLKDAAVYVSANETVTFTGNTVEGAYVNINSYTTGNTLDVTATGNTLAANTGDDCNRIQAGGTVDAQGEFVVPAKGSNSLAYTKEENGYVRVWGEGGGNAKESYVLKLYSGETLIATTELNNVDNVIDGDVYVTWNFYYPESTDKYWTTTWEEGHPNSAAQPTEVELYIDGTLVATTAAKMSGADDVAPVVWRNLGGVAIANLLGEGTETSPYLISNKKELLWLQAKVDELATDGSTQFAGKYFKLTADIDLAGVDWNPIGSMSGDHGSFKGVFDGGDHTISNLKVEQAGNGIGLFARTAGNAVIKNLKLNNVSVKSTDNSNYAGALVGNAYASTKIENVHVSGNVYVSGRGYIGGIAGHGYVVMDNVSVVATGDGQGNDKGLITSTFWCAGGILGYAGEGSTNIMNANVENVVVTSAAGGLGAIVGMAEDNNGTQPISGSNLSAKDVDIKTYIGAYGDAYANYALGYLYGGNPTSKLTGELSVENVTLATSNGVDPTPVDAVAKVNDAIYFSLQEALNAAAAGTGDVTVEILRDVDLTGIEWNPVTVSAAGYPVVTVEGNNKTITGLNDMLFAGTWAGKSGLIIKNLKIANSTIVNDKDDAAGTVGVGAFIGFPQASETITLENCHLKNSRVEGGHWTGGLIGYAAGYAGNDGPVFMNLTVKGCSVTGSTITGKGSVGGIIGHGSGNGWTNVVIENTTVSGNTITSTGSSNVKAGAIMGTIGAAGQPTTANGVTKTGGASVSATVAGNTVTSNGTAITTIYGRQGTPTGQLYVAGGSYDNYPIEQGVAYAAPIEGYVIVKNDDNTYGLDEKVELPEVEITDIKGTLTDSDPDLTFALNFTIKDLENLDEEYLNKVMEQYGSWYTDYVLTISGLTDENVTFNANGNGDGYLAGQYDGFGPSWVSVPFENVTLANNESIYIMEYAAKLMGQSGLRYTLAEIVSIVMDFDCGVYFTPEFLTANPGLKVDLHLKVFTEDAEGNKVNDINVATNNFDIEDYVAIVHADGKQTAYCTTLAEAVAAAEADETITLIADVELTETLNIPAGKTIALDLNGKTISQTKEQTAGYQMILNDGNLTIDDSSEAKTGKISYTDSGNGGEYISDVIYNRSVLVINGGTIENLSSATVASNGYPHAVDTYSGIRDTYVEINGGTIYCAEYSAIRMFCVSATNKADLVINGGTIKGAIDMQNGTKNLALGTLTINDGTFETTKNANNIRFANWNGGATEYGISAEIKGGSFNGGITTAYVPAAANWDKGVITGGTFAKDMTEYCADGYLCEANGDDTYEIVTDPNYIAEFTIDDANPEDYTSDLAGKKVGKLTYKRTFIAGIWNPMFVPFEIDIDILVNEFGLEVASYNQMISSEQADGSFKYKMEVKHRTSGKVSHYPLFVRTEDSYKLEYVAEDVVLSSADEFVITTNSVANTFKLHGTHQAKTKEDLAGMYAIGATTGLWTPSSSGIKPHRLYLEILDNSNDPFASSVPAKSIRIVVEGEDGTTGVDEIVGENAEEMIFDLQGRRVLEPQKGGMYIINGKKVIY